MLSLLDSVARRIGKHSAIRLWNTARIFPSQYNLQILEKSIRSNFTNFPHILCASHAQVMSIKE